MKSNRLDMQQLSIARDGALLIPPFDYTLESGEVLVVRGANGSGKSSLLKCIAGLLPPASGHIHLNGVPLASFDAGTVLYMGHARGMVPALSVYDNVAFWARAYGQPELIDAALHYFDLADVADVTLRTLSAGWQQRVALTRLITQPGHIWLLDEPTGHLDTDGATLLQSLMQSRLEQGGIAMLATHGVFAGERVKTLDLTLLNPLHHVGEVC